MNYVTVCSIRRADEDLKPRKNWLDILIEGEELLAKSEEFFNSLPTYLTGFSRSRVKCYVKCSVQTWLLNKRPIKSATCANWIPKESEVPSFPILVGCSVIASKSVSKIYVLPLLN